MKSIKSILVTVSRILSSPRFFWSILGLFVLESVWIALVGRYPQAFDEQFHFGVIQLHAQQWWPFFVGHPVGADSYGAIGRDPSFLYHYLFSYVYRLIRLFTADMTIQIIIIRLINVALAASAFVIFRLLLREMKLSAAKSHVILALVALLPVYPLLAGEINYDNLFVPLTALVLLLAVRLYKYYSDSGRLDWARLAWLLLLMVLTSTVKMPFLPIFLGVVLFFVPIVWRQRHGAWTQIKTTVIKSDRVSKICFVLVLLLAGLAFGGSYGYNLLSYHTPAPKCHKVLSSQQCSSYGPWLRDYLYKQSRVAPSPEDIVTYPHPWAQYMMRESFFTIYSKFGTPPVVNYYVSPALPIMTTLGWIWLWFSLAVFVLSLPCLWRNKLTRLMLLVGGIYLAALFYTNIRGFINTSVVVAVHGRYLFPVLVPLLACVALGYDNLLGKMSMKVRQFPRAIVTLAAGATLLIFIFYGGFTTYLVRSNDDWFWPQSQTAKNISGRARGILRAIVITD